MIFPSALLTVWFSAHFILRYGMISAQTPIITSQSSFTLYNNQSSSYTLLQPAYHLSSNKGVASPAGDLSGFLGDGRGEALTLGLLGVTGLALLCLAQSSAALAQSVPAELVPGFEPA